MCTISTVVPARMSGSAQIVKWPMGAPLGQPDPPARAQTEFGHEFTETPLALDRLSRGISRHFSGVEGRDPVSDLWVSSFLRPGPGSEPFSPP